MKEHLLLQVGDTIKIEGEKGTWEVLEVRNTNKGPWYFVCRVLLNERIATYKWGEQEWADTKVKKLMRGVSHVTT